MNTNKQRLYLEYAVHLLDLDYFDPMEFCADGVFTQDKYTEVVDGFFSLLCYLDSCKISLTVNNIGSKDNYDFELQDSDFTEMDLSGAVIPEKCEKEDFSLVNLYLILRTGAALNKKAIENLLDKKLNDANVVAIRKDLEEITSRTITKRKDNSYEMGEWIDE